MTARLRGCAQYEKAAGRLAVHWIQGLGYNREEDWVDHEDEGETRPNGRSLKPGFYPVSAEGQ
jgi:hypothetical protein